MLETCWQESKLEYPCILIVVSLSTPEQVGKKGEE
jgi:hypothetical protein